MKLDAKNLLCPMPVIKVQDAIATMNAGDILEVTCTDPGALYDIPAWCRVHGHSILKTNQKGREVFISIQVKSS